MDISNISKSITNPFINVIATLTLLQLLFIAVLAWWFFHRPKMQGIGVKFFQAFSLFIGYLCLWPFGRIVSAFIESDVKSLLQKTKMTIAETLLNFLTSATVVIYKIGFIILIGYMLFRLVQWLLSGEKAIHDTKE